MTRDRLVGDIWQTAYRYLENRVNREMVSTGEESEMWTSLDSSSRSLT